MARSFLEDMDLREPGQREVRGQQRQQGSHTQVGESDAQPPASQCKHEALGDQLVQKTSPARTQGGEW
jgi:hypothetical protein